GHPGAKARRRARRGDRGDRPHAAARRPDDPGLLDTLGAAYAAAGRFKDAIAAAERAEELASTKGDTALRDRIRQRLVGYRAGEAWVAAH
ncbi:MAG TPA: hypothetical protein VNF72_14675, partial [Myxococcota bacterium]|nr:hypothetical protein [Myxococcota bacterium]